MSRFEAALEKVSPLRQLGDTRFTYEPSMLVGSAFPARNLLVPRLLRGLSAGLGAAALLCLLLPGASTWLAVVFTLLCAVGVLGGTNYENRRRLGRRFVLNFATETLRLDGVSSVGALPRTTLIPFDEVKDVIATELSGGARGTYRLGVRCARGAALEQFTLVEGITEAEGERFAQAYSFLRAAFGLRPAEEASAPPLDRVEE